MVVKFAVKIVKRGGILDMQQLHLWQPSICYMSPQKKSALHIKEECTKGLATNPISDILKKSLT